MVSIPACHAGDRGSIPRRGGQIFFSPFSLRLFQSNPVFLFKYVVANSVDIKLSAHDAPAEQSALGTLKIERLDRQATQKFLQSNTTKRTAMVTRARGIITQIRKCKFQ